MEGQFAPDQLENINPTVIPDFTTTRTAEDILTTTDTAEGVLAGIGAGFVFVWLVLFVLTLAAMWKVFTKAGKPGWAALIPIYNTYVLLQIVGRPWWWLLLMLVPFVNIVVAIILNNDLAKSFGKGVGWTFGLIFLPIIFYSMLAFGSAKYKGPAASQR